MGSVFPRPGSEPVPSAVETRTLNHWAATEVPGENFSKRVLVDDPPFRAPESRSGKSCYFQVEKG